MKKLVGQRDSSLTLRMTQDQKCAAWARGDWRAAHLGHEFTSKDSSRSLRMTSGENGVKNNKKTAFFKKWGRAARNFSRPHFGRKATF